MGMNCRKADYYLAKKEEHKLSSWESFNLWFHFLHCHACRTLKKQLHRITGALKNWEPADTLSETEKNTLKNNLSGNF